MEQGMELVLELQTLIEGLKDDGTSSNAERHLKWGAAITQMFKRLQTAEGNTKTFNQSLKEKEDALDEKIKGLQDKIDSFGTPSKAELEADIKQLREMVANLPAAFRKAVTDENALQHAQDKANRLQGVETENTVLRAKYDEAVRVQNDLKAERDRAIDKKESAEENMSEANAAKGRAEDGKAAAEEAKIAAVKEKEAAEGVSASLKGEVEKLQQQLQEATRKIEDGDLLEKATNGVRTTFHEWLGPKPETTPAKSFVDVTATNANTVETFQKWFGPKPAVEPVRYFNDVVDTNTQRAIQQWLGPKPAVEPAMYFNDVVDTNTQRAVQQWFGPKPAIAPSTTFTDVASTKANTENVLQQWLGPKPAASPVTPFTDGLSTIVTTESALQQWLGPKPATPPATSLTEVTSSNFTTLNTAVTEMKQQLQPAIVAFNAASAQPSRRSSPNPFTGSSTSHNQYPRSAAPDHPRPTSSGSTTESRPPSKGPRLDGDDRPRHDGDQQSRPVGDNGPQQMIVPYGASSYPMTQPQPAQDQSGMGGGMGGGMSGGMSGGVYGSMGRGMFFGAAAPAGNSAGNPIGYGRGVPSSFTGHFHPYGSGQFSFQSPQTMGQHPAGQTSTFGAATNPTPGPAFTNNPPLAICIKDPVHISNSVLDNTAKELINRDTSGAVRTRYSNATNKPGATENLNGCYPAHEKDRKAEKRAHDRVSRCPACIQKGRHCFILRDPNTALLMEPTQAERTQQARFDTINGALA